MVGLFHGRIKKEQLSQKRSKPSLKRAVNHNICGLTTEKNIITDFKEPLQKHNITLYSTENEDKSSVCERWNRTIKTKMWK